MLVLPQTLTQLTARASLADLSTALRAEPQHQVEVDARGLQHFDSAALAVLLALRRQALSARKSWQVSGLPTRLGDLARVYGVVDLLGQSPVPPATVASSPP